MTLKYLVNCTRFVVVFFTLGHCRERTDTEKPSQEEPCVAGAQAYKVSMWLESGPPLLGVRVRVRSWTWSLGLMKAGVRHSVRTPRVSPIGHVQGKGTQRCVKIAKWHISV